MTTKTSGDTMTSRITTDKMAQRQQLQVDSRVTATRLILNSIASDESLRLKRKVTVRELVYSSLAEKWGDKYPALRKAIEEELS